MAVMYLTEFFLQAWCKSGYMHSFGADNDVLMWALLLPHTGLWKLNEHRQAELGPGLTPRQPPCRPCTQHTAGFPYQIKDGFPGVCLFPKISKTLIHFNLPGTQ